MKVSLQTQLLNVVGFCWFAAILAVGANAEFPCSQHSQAVSKEKVCTCSQETGYAGGCMAVPGSNDFCSVLNYYPCSEGFDSNFAYTETFSQCNTFAKPRPINSSMLQQDLTGMSMSTQGVMLVLAALQDDQRPSKNNCVALNTTFKEWLASELQAPKQAQ